MQPEHTIGQEHVRLSSRRPARAQSVPRQGNYPPHDHEFYEVGVATAGRALHRTRDGAEWLERGSVVVVPPREPHAYERAEGFGVINVYYLAEWFLSEPNGLRGAEGVVELFFERALFPDGLRGGAAHVRLTEAELRACLADLADLEAEWACAAPQPLFCEAALLKCMIRVARASGRAPRGDGGAPRPRAVALAVASIERAVRLGLAPRLGEVARAAGMSAAHLCRVFRAATGTSPGAYFQRLRIQRACRALLAGRETAAEIAHGLGYADSAHFNRGFKKIVGLTPCRYRARFSAGPGAR